MEGAAPSAPLNPLAVTPVRQAQGPERSRGSAPPSNKIIGPRDELNGSNHDVMRHSPVRTGPESATFDVNFPELVNAIDVVGMARPPDLSLSNGLGAPSRTDGPAVRPYHRTHELADIL